MPFRHFAGGLRDVFSFIYGMWYPAFCILYLGTVLHFDLRRQYQSARRDLSGHTYEMGWATDGVMYTSAKGNKITLWAAGILVTTAEVESAQGRRGFYTCSRLKIEIWIES